MIKNKELEYILGLMEENIKASGKMENNMVLENILQEQENEKMVNGYKVKESDGQIL